MSPQESGTQVIRVQVHSTDPGRSTPKLIEQIQKSAPQVAKRLKAAEVEIEREQAIPIDPATQILLIKLIHYVGPIIVSELTKRAVNVLLDMFQDVIVEPADERDESTSKEREKPAEK